MERKGEDWRGKEGKGREGEERRGKERKGEDYKVIDKVKLKEEIMETKPYSEVSQQLRNYNISVPKFEDRGDLNEMDDIMPKDGFCSIYRTTNVEKYRDVMEHFLKLMALEASSATHSDKYVASSIS